MIQPLYTSGLTGGNPVSPLLMGRWAHHSQSASSPMPAPGTLASWRIVLASAVPSGQTLTLAIYKGGAPTALSITMAAGSVGGSVAASAAFAAGNLADVRWSSTGGDVTVEYASVLEWTPDDGVTGIYGYGQAGLAQLYETTTLYDGAFFGGGLDLAEPPAASYVGSGAGGLVTAHYVNLNTPPGLGTSRAFVPILNTVPQDGSGGSTDASVTLSGSTTTDGSTFSLAVPSGALVSVRGASTGATATTGGSGGIAFVPTIPGQFPIGMDAYVLSGDGTSYARITGSYDSGVWTSTESARRLIGSDTTVYLTGMSAYATIAPGMGKTRTYTLIVNGSPTGQTVTLADGNVVAICSAAAVQIGASDRFSLQEVRTGTPAGGNVKVTWYLSTALPVYAGWA